MFAATRKSSLKWLTAFNGLSVQEIKTYASDRRAYVAS
jgi:hypothetical protein